MSEGRLPVRIIEAGLAPPPAPPKQSAGLPPKQLKVVSATVIPRKAAPAAPRQRRPRGSARGLVRSVGAVVSLAGEVFGGLGPGFERVGEAAVDATDPDDWRRAVGELSDGRLSLWRVDGER